MDRYALVTGAGGGIGLEIARILASDGYNLVLVDLQENTLREFVGELAVTYPERSVVPISLDLCRDGAAEDILAILRERRLRTEVLVNNAGFGTLGLFRDTDWERERRMIRLHVESLTHLSKLLLPGMLERGKGRILNVASVAGFLPSPLMAVYNASKAYVISFSQALANELEGTGVSVTVLCPGLTRTGFQAAVGVGNPEFTKSRWLSKSPEEVAAYAVQSMYNGRVLAVPGRLNRLTVFFQRLLPRKTLVRTVRRMQERNRRFLPKDQ